MGNVEREYLNESGRELRRLKDLADQALKQVSVANLYTSLDEDGNCIAVLMKHLAGFLRSRWTDFLDGDGEKTDRRPEREFLIEEGESSQVIEGKWEKGWSALFQTLESLQEDDLLRRVLIGGRNVTVLRSIQITHSHVALHVGQIIFLAKHMKGCDWNPLRDAESNSSGPPPILVDQQCGGST